MSDTERIFQQLSQLDHVKVRSSMYIGSIQLDTTPMYILNDETSKFELVDTEFPAGLLKIIDEVLVNATDHHTTFPKLVTDIKIAFNKESGEVSIENNGPGIPVVEVETLNHGTMYQCQAIFSEFLSGDNFQDTDDKIVGGQNGLGAKVSSAFSDYFNVETYDEKSKTLYTQSFRERLTIIDEPVLTKYNNEESKDKKGYTKVTFLPSYKEFGYKKFSKRVSSVIYKLIETRAFQTSAFVGKNCKIWFDDEPLEFDEGDKSMFYQFAEMFVTNEYGLHSTILAHPSNKQLNMEVCIGISDGKARNVSIINGISVFMGGTHIKHITNEIVANILPKMEALLPKDHAKIQPSVILNNLFVFAKCSVVNPKFDSQSKSKLTTPINNFEMFKFKEKGKNNDWDPIWELLKDHVMASIIDKIKDKTKTRIARGKIHDIKGRDAKFAGDKKTAPLCALFLCEGESAKSLLESGINHKGTELQRDYCGVYSIQGVCINARKETDIYFDKSENKDTIIRTEKLQNNIRFNNMVRMLGLDYNKKYTFGTAEGDREVASLRYGKAIIATDADTDGRGQIGALLVNFFTLFWPELVKRGFVKTFVTSMIRAYPKKAGEFVKEFNSLYGFDQWIIKDFKGDHDDMLKLYTINYYKGLASIQDEEIFPTFKNFDTKLNTFKFDKSAKETLDVYFGKDTNPRKLVLCSPIDEKDIVKYNKSNELSISTFLSVDTKEFQRDNIMRKLPHIMDGLVPSRRKTLFAARKHKTMHNTKVKVNNFTGFVTEQASYMHGDMSLSATIIKMAQSFIGARNIPLLIGLGQLGTRRMGGTDAGSSRYVYVKINKVVSDAVYPHQDDFLLPYTFEDGERCEPQYYCPVVPMCLLESMQIPATGWRIKLWARDYESVIKNVKKMIECKITKCKALPIWLRGNKSDIRVASDGREYMVGKYVYHEKTNIVQITELPISVFNDKYIKNIAYNKDKTLRKEFKNVEDYSSKEGNVDTVDIQFELQPETMDLIKEKYTVALKANKAIVREIKALSKAASKTKHVDKSEMDIDDMTDELDKMDIDSIPDDLISIEDYVADVLFDPIEEYFKLRLCINSDINVIGVQGEVREFQYYGSLVNIWFKERKRLYKERIERQLILKKLYILYLENIVRFAKERDVMKITNKTALDKFDKILEENKYDKFNKSLLLSPKYLPAVELNDKILNSDSSYNYIIDLTYRSLLKEACVKREEELEKEKKILADILDDFDTSEGHFIGQKTWIRELEVADKVIKTGLAKGWNIEKNPPKFA